MKDIVLDIAHTSIQTFVPVIFSVFLPWLWTVLRKNMKVNTASKLLQIDEAKQRMINEQAKTVVLAVEEYYYKQLKTGNQDGKMSSDAKKDLAIEMLAEKFPGESNDAFSQAVDAAVSTLRPPNPIDRLSDILESKKLPEEVVNQILPYLEKVIKTETAKNPSEV